MARKGEFIPENEVESASRSGRRASMDDYDSAGQGLDRDGEMDAARLMDLEPEQESPFLRAQKRIPARRGPLPKKTANWLKRILLLLAVTGIAGAAAFGIYRYGEKSWRFRVESSDHIQISGTENVTRKQVLGVFGGDISRNIFSIPLAERKKQLEEIPWVESATVMRFLPNRLKVEIRERTPIAFVQIGLRTALADANGVVMERPSGLSKKYSFPVIVGLADSEPRSTWAARMKIYSTLVNELDADGARYSQDLSEVDLTDPDDVKVVVNDGGVLIHLGSSDYLARFKSYIAHVQEWRQQYPGMKSVDLRYRDQVIVNPGYAAPEVNSPATEQKSAASETPPVAVESKTAASKKNAKGTKNSAASKKKQPKHR